MKVEKKGRRTDVRSLGCNCIIYGEVPKELHYIFYTSV